jgi:hypothetical protein
VTVAPFFQDAGNAHAALARRSATSIDTVDWRGCGLYDASYLSKYSLTPEGPACMPGGFCAVSSQFFDCLPYSGGTVRTTCAGLLTLCSDCGKDYVSCDNTANPFCLTWHFGAAITGWGCGPQQQEGSIISPNLTPWFPPTLGIPTALLTEAAITLVQGTPTFPSSTTTSSITSIQSYEIAPTTVTPTTVIIVTSTVPPTPALSGSVKVGVSVGISISALIIIAVAVLF